MINESARLVTVYADPADFKDSLSSVGSYTVELRAFALNGVDTGAFETLAIEVQDPCRVEAIEAPSSPLDLQTYHIGAPKASFDIQKIAERDRIFHHPYAICGSIDFSAELYYFTDPDDGF